MMIQVIISAIVLVVLIFFFRKASKDKSKWGISLTRKYCPVCDTKQPVIRMPDSFDQAMWGGTTCPKCHTRLDKYGNVKK